MTPADFARLVQVRLSESPYLVHPVLRDLARGRYAPDAVRTLVLHLNALVRRQPVILGGAIATLTPYEQAALASIAEDPAPRIEAFDRVLRLLGVTPAAVRQTMVVPELDGYLLAIGSVSVNGPLQKLLGVLWAIEMQTGAENLLLIETLRQHAALVDLEVAAALPAPSGCGKDLAAAVARHAGDELTRKLVIEGTDLVLRLRYNFWQAIQAELQLYTERFAPAAIWHGSAAL